MTSRTNDGERNDNALETAVRKVTAVYFEGKLAKDILEDLETGQVENVRDAVLELLKCRHENNPIALPATKLRRIYRDLQVEPPVTPQRRGH
jgi:hypothetical protein